MHIKQLKRLFKSTLLEKSLILSRLFSFLVPRNNLQSSSSHNTYNLQSSTLDLQALLLQENSNIRSKEPEQKSEEKNHLPNPIEREEKESFKVKKHESGSEKAEKYESLYSPQTQYQDTRSLNCSRSPEIVSRTKASKVKTSAKKEVSEVAETKTPKKRYSMKFNHTWIEVFHQDYKGFVEILPSNEFKFYDKACCKELDCDYMNAHVHTLCHEKAYTQWKEANRNVKTLDSKVALGQSVTLIESKLTIYLVKKNAPMAWANDLMELIKSCYPNQPEAKAINLDPKKCNWISESL